MCKIVFFLFFFFLQCLEVVRQSSRKTWLLIYFLIGSMLDHLHMAKTLKFSRTPNVLIIQISVTRLTCFLAVFKQAGKIKYTEAPVLLQSFEQRHVSICDNTESSETHHGQGTGHNFSILSSSYSSFKVSFYADDEVWQKSWIQTFWSSPNKKLLSKSII